MSDLFAVFGVNWKLLLIQGLNFGVLLALLSYLLYKPMFAVITERQKKIEQGVTTAEAAAQKLKEAHGESKKIVGNAAREAEGLVATARTQAEEQGGGIVKAAEKRAGSILKDAAARAEEAKRQALHESEREIARAAMLAAEKVIRAHSEGGREKSA